MDGFTATIAKDGAAGLEAAKQGPKKQPSGCFFVSGVYTKINYK